MPTTALQHFLYVSRLAPGVQASSVPSILEVSRARNRAMDVTGILVFDGERFAQWLEGPPGQVLALAARIEADMRHADMTVLHTGVRAAAGRLATHWRAGYAEAGDLEFLGSAARAGAHDAALSHFLAAIPRFDLST